ncbi:hypothetical protein ACHQM5_018743 [Ranunculus cassubicifolius]
MAEALVSFVIKKLGNALIQEAAFFKGVHRQFERLQKELISINGFLRSADMKRCDDPSILIWVADVRDIAYDVDDIIDLFIIKVTSEQRRKIGSINLLRQCAQVSKKLLNSYKIGKGIQSLFARIEEIDKRRQRYGITITIDKRDEASSSTSNEIWLRRTYPGVEDDNIIGLGEATNSLVTELMKEGGRLRVVSICGMGGLGKTTLAKRVYYHKNVRNHFDCYAWTFISQECRLVNVLQEILRQVSNLSTNERGKMTEVEVLEKLFGILEEKRYLVVLDDIWREDAWDMLKSAFPNGKNGSKLMLTSRSTKVALHADPWGFHFEPRLLNGDEAWDLICKIASSDDDAGTSLSLIGDMEKCGREMVQKCGGLPLSIVVLGGILARKKTLRQWETVAKDIGHDGVLSVLALSYNNLPFHLKPLYLYFGLYPEDYQIPVKDVIRMWIAEGMVISKPGSQLTMEEVGEQYIEELIQRSMIQVGSKKQSGGVRTCQLHDMMRDLAILKANEEDFFQIIGNDKIQSDGSSSLAMATSKLRRCAIYAGKERYAFSPHIIPHIRSVLIFKGLTYGYSSSSTEIAYKDFKLTRVLNFPLDLGYSRFHGVSMGSFQVIGKLTNLRYLGLSGFGGKELPKSIGNLVFLETLNVRGSHVRLPNVIWKMSRLRHLYMYRKTEIIGGRLRLDTLKQLQTLRGMKGKWGITDLVKLTSLRKLNAFELTTDMVKTIVDYVAEGLDNLRSIKLWASEEFPDLERLSQNRHLLKMKLHGKMTSYPSNWPSSLVKLLLAQTEISEDPMPTLEKLQHLEYLSFEGNFVHKRIVCSRSGFPQLQHLRLEYLEELEEWIVEKGAMPCLIALVIDSCRRLKKIPEGVKFLTKLKQLDVIEMPKTFRERVKEGAEDWQSVQHISSITITNTVSSLTAFNLNLHFLSLI